MPRDILSVALEGALCREGCAICALLLRQERHRMWILLWENANDPEIRELLDASGGFCHRHAWWMGRRGEQSGPMAMAIIYESLIGQLLGRCGAHARPQPLAAVGARCPDGATPGRACPACAAMAEMQWVYLVFGGRAARSGRLPSPRPVGKPGELAGRTARIPVQV